MAYQRYIGRNYTAGNVTPSSNGAVSLGQPQKRWKEVYVEANSLHLGNVSFSIGKTNQLELMRTDKLGHPVANVVLANAVAKPIIVMDGGTGASTFTDGGVLLGSGAGAITAMSVLTDGQMIVGDGTTDPVAESGATLRTSIGVGTGDSPQFTAVNIGAATDTTVARASAGDINVEGNLIYRAGGTDVPVADGGTGASSFTDGYVLLGSGTGAITALNVTVKGSILAGDGTTDPVALGVGDNDQVLVADSGEATGLKWAASPATVANRSITQAKLAENSVGGSKVRANVLTGGQIIGSVVGFQSNVTGNVSVSRSLAVGYTDGRIPQANLEVKGNAHIVGATTITGALTLGTDLAVAQGGTGASTFTDGGVLLGSGTGAITALAVLTDGQMIVGDGTTDPVAESGDTLRNSIGVGTTASGTVMQIALANTSGNVRIARNLAVGYANLERPGANLDVKGNAYISGATTIAGALTLGTDLAVAQGGTGASTFTDGGVLLGSGTGAITALAVLTNGQMIVGDGTTDPVAESGATLRTSIGVGTGDSPQFTAVNIGAATDTTVARASAGDINVEGNLIYRAGGTDVPVADGGTGASTFTDGGVLLGSGTSAVTAMAVLTNGQMIVGDGTTDPVAESGATLRTSIGVGTGDNVEFTDVKSTGVILAADGAVDAPSITNTGDLNTGIWYPAADTIAISTGGAEALRISGVGQNATVSSHVVNHKGLATANYTEYANNITNAGSSFTVSTGTNIARYTLNVATCAITLPTGQPITPGTMKTIILFLKQDGTGGRVVNFAAPSGETLEWNNSASEPEAVTGASKVSIYTFMKFHGDTRWYCSQSFIEN